MTIKMPVVATSHLRRVSALLVLALSLAIGLPVLDHADDGMMQHYAVAER